MKKKTLWIARTSLMIAVLVALQYITKPLGQLVTGSSVNMVLVVATLFGGFWCGFTTALLSPFFAFLLGIGPALFPLTPCIAVGNLVLVCVYAFMQRKLGSGIICKVCSVVAGAVLKFAALFLLIVKAVLPMLGLPEAKTAAMSAMFTWPQLFTALLGGAVAVVIVAALEKANLKK